MRMAPRGRKEKAAELLLMTMFLLVIAGAAVSFAYNLKQTADKRTNYLMGEAAEQYASAFYTGVMAKLDAVDTIAGILGDMREPEPAELHSVLRQVARQGKFHLVVFSRPDGRGVTQTGASINVAGQDFFIRALAGEKVISEAITSSVDNAQILVLATPVWRGHEVVGVLSCGYRLSDLEAMTKRPRYFGEAYGMVFTKQGAVVAWERHRNAIPGSGNVVELLASSSMRDGMTVQQLRDNMAAGWSGVFSTEYQGQIRIVSYTPLGLNDWYAFSFAPNTIYLQETAEISHIVLLLVAELLLAVAAVFLYILHSDRRHARVLTQANLRLAVSEERFRMAVESADHIMFDFDCISGCYVDFANSEKMLGKTREQINGDLAFIYKLDERERAAAINQYLYHPCDFDVVMEQSLVAMERGEASYDARIHTGAGDYIWCRVHLTVLKESDGKPYRVLGFLGNIDAVKRQAETFKTRSEKDALTGFYNKAAAVSLINDALTCDAETPHTLFAMDIDNFKTINDTMGHLAGDAVIAETAERLRALFRSGDILGRIGGDEFVVLIKGVSEQDHVIRKANEIIEAFHTMTQSSRGCFNVSVSIGILVCTGHSTYEDAFMKADKALYEAKRGGKNQYVFYDQPISGSAGYTQE